MSKLPYTAFPLLSCALCAALLTSCNDVLSITISPSPQSTSISNNSTQQDDKPSGTPEQSRTPTVSATFTSTSIPSPTPTATPQGGGDGRIIFRMDKHAFATHLPLSGDEHVFIAKVNGNDLIPISEGLAANNFPLGLSPDGTKLLVASFLSWRAYHNGYASLYVVDIQSMERTLLTYESRAGTWGAGAIWLNDSQHIAFIGKAEDGFAIYKIQSDGSGLRRLTSPQSKPGYILPISYPNGIVWQQGDILGNNIYTICDPSCYAQVSLDGSKQEFIWFGIPQTFESQITYSPSGEEFAFDSIKFANQNGDIVQSISFQGNVCIISWSPNGKYLLLGKLKDGSMCGGYYLWDFETSSMTKLPSDLPYSWEVRWSPDSRQVILLGINEISPDGISTEAYLLNIDTYQSFPFFEDFDGAYNQFIWIP